MSTKDYQLESMFIRQVCEYIRLNFAFASSRTNPNHKVRNMHQVWEEFKIHSTPSDSIHIDGEIMSALVLVHRK